MRMRAKEERRSRDVVRMGSRRVRRLQVVGRMEGLKCIIPGRCKIQRTWNQRRRMEITNQVQYIPVVRGVAV